MAKEKTRGKLSKQGEEFIRVNSANMPPEKIAEHIGKSEKTVNRFIFRQNLPKFLDNFETKNRRKLVDILRTRPYWEKIKQNYKSDEIILFQNLWADLMEQFDEDVTPTEEMQIHKYITLYLLRERAIVRQNKFQITLDRVTELLKGENEKPQSERNPELVKQLANSVQSLTLESKGVSREIKELIAEESRIETALKGTRDQRIKQVHDTKKNWGGVLQALESPKTRRDLGKHLEIMKAAAEKAQHNISQPHQYFDKSIDLPLLNSDTVDNLEYEESEGFNNE